MSSLTRIRQLLIASGSRRRPLTAISALRQPVLTSQVQQHFSTRTKYSVQLDAATAQQLATAGLKPRRHPGTERGAVDSATAAAGAHRLDAATVAAIERALGDHPAKQVWADSLHLQRYLRARHAPSEPEDLRDRRAAIELQVRDAQPQRFAALDAAAAAAAAATPNGDHDLLLDAPDLTAMRRQLQQRVDKLMAQRTYKWRPIEYDAYRALQYLVARAPPEYAALRRIFGELAKRRPAFRPRSFLDFGAGVGTGTWAASAQWPDTIFEYFAVDAAREMNDLAELVLRGGDENRAMRLRNVNYRQFLPAAPEPKYDLVLSAFSLLELPDARNRLETLRTLWQKCDRYLVIVEQGTRAGFHLVNEARDYLLYSGRQSAEADGRGHSDCRVFAPCPHDLACPRFADASDRTPCNFLAPYTQLPFVGGGAAAAAEIRHEPYSYVVLEKRWPDETVDYAEADAWPRLVRPTLVRARHSICRMCTAAGRLDEIIFTKTQHDRDAYRCAKASRWGDRLPMRLQVAPDGGAVVAERKAGRRAATSSSDGGEAQGQTEASNSSGSSSSSENSVHKNT